MILLNEEVTDKTRLDAWLSRTNRVEDIKRVLGEHAMTAREIAYALGFTERNAVAPRLTEMMKRGEVFVCGRTKDKVTGKSVAVYRLMRKE